MPSTIDLLFMASRQLGFGFVVVLVAIMLHRRTRIRAPILAVFISLALCSVTVLSASFGFSVLMGLAMGQSAVPFPYGGESVFKPVLDFLGLWLGLYLVTRLALWFQKNEKIKSTVFAVLVATPIIYFSFAIITFSCLLLLRRFAL